MLRTFSGILQDRLTRYSSVAIAFAFALSGLMPIILVNSAGAAQLSQRNVVLSTSEPGENGSYTFNFEIKSSYALQGLIFQFCSTPLGSCSLPEGNGGGDEMNLSTATAGAFTGTNSTAFAKVTTDTGACDEADGGAAATMVCVNRTQPAAESATAPNDAKSFVVGSITNPGLATNTNNTQVYVRITTFSDTAFADDEDAGTVAASIVSQLIVSGRVQERLVFCVFALGDTPGSSATQGAVAGNMPDSCSAAEANDGTNVDLGVIDNSDVFASPVDNNPPSSLGNDKFGAAIINTNASSGVTMSYYATDGTGTDLLKAFRVPGAVCDDGNATFIGDQCFNSASGSGATITQGTELFGMQLACVVNSTTTTNGIGTTSNLGKAAGAYAYGSGTGGSVNSAYDAGRGTAPGASFDDGAGNDCEGGTTPALSDKVAWNTTTTAAPLISSDTVVDDEMVKFRYLVTASPTTPTGTYTVASTYIATPTF